MTYAWTRRALPVAMLLLTACDDAATGPPLHPGEEPTHLSFLFPALAPGALVVTTLGGDQPSFPARVVESDEELPPPPDEPIDPATLPASDIWDAKTTVGFQTGSAWAAGSHRYQGNKGSVQTTVKVALDGVEIGSQSALRQDDAIFWLDFGIAKHIQVIVRAYVQQECGLAAWANSEHRAWWEAVPGASIATFGMVVRPSASNVANQPECEPEEPPPSGGVSPGQGGYCYVQIWYDLDTGEILDYQVLYCDSELGG